MGLFDFFKRKKESNSKCSSCGEKHDQLPALGFSEPYHYSVLTEDDKNELAEISDDFCVIRHSDQTDRFIRATITIKVIDACENLDYGIWVSLSQNSFNDYSSKFKTNSEEETYFGMICNEIQDYDESTVGIHVDVQTRSIGIRPNVVPQENQHQLVMDWKNGISMEEAEKRLERCLEQILNKP